MVGSQARGRARVRAEEATALPKRDEITGKAVEALSSALDAFGSEPLTLLQIQALLYVCAHPGCSIAEIAVHLRVDASCASRHVKLLGSEGRGERPGARWMFTKADTQDRRSKHVFPTSLGVRVVSRALAAIGHD